MSGKTEAEMSFCFRCLTSVSTNVCLMGAAWVGSESLYCLSEAGIEHLAVGLSSFFNMVEFMLSHNFFGSSAQHYVHVREYNNPSIIKPMMIAKLNKTMIS
ncbi:hypothetical protein NC651_007914 [Populus alba x Populus x berolinensis]|nr:hypothetical protein NC651_007914 [Populus alba x Populus x berolinensis]